MGTTPVKGMRFPDLSQLGMGPDDFNKMAYDLDGAYTGEDTSRTRALYRNRSYISGIAAPPNIAKTTWLTATYDTVLIDTSGMANLGVNNDRLTCKSQGAYLVIFSMGIVVSGPLGTAGVVLSGVSKGIVTAIPDPNFSVHQYTAQYNAAVIQASAWTVFQLNVNDFVTGRLFWNGTPAGPFSTSSTSLIAIQLNST